MALIPFNKMQAQIQPDSIQVLNNSCFEVFINEIPVKEKMSLEKSWITNNFGDYKSVLQYEDEVKNTIVIKGFLELYGSELESSVKKLQKMIGQATDKRNMFFTIEFSNKDDRYRVKISDITIKILSVSLGGLRADFTYDEFIDQGVKKARLNVDQTQKKLDNLRSLNTNEMKSNEIKKHNKEIAECEKDLAKYKEKLEEKTKKSEKERIWLNTILSNIFNSINNHIQNKSDDEF